LLNVEQSARHVGANEASSQIRLAASVIGKYPPFWDPINLNPRNSLLLIIDEIYGLSCLIMGGIQSGRTRIVWAKPPSNSSPPRSSCAVSSPVDAGIEGLLSMR